MPLPPNSPPPLAIPKTDSIAVDGGVVVAVKDVDEDSFDVDDDAARFDIKGVAVMHLAIHIMERAMPDILFSSFMVECMYLILWIE